MTLPSKLLCFLAALIVMASHRSSAQEINGTDIVVPSTAVDDILLDGTPDCAKTLRKFDPNLHKKKYKVAVHAIRGNDQAYLEYNLTFSEYLTATAGKRFDPPIEFEMVSMNQWELFDAVDEEEIDFFFANPGTYTCVGTEWGTQALATVVSRLEVRGKTYDLDVFGGVMFASAENDAVNKIEDLKDKIIAAGSLSMIMGGQYQFYDMQKAGLSYVMDPKQVVFTHDQDNVVNGVLSGAFDVGFVRTDQIERTVDPKTGKPINPDLFKIIEPQIYLMDTGDLFPFFHSTDIIPEFAFSALNYVPVDVSLEVQEALLALESHAQERDPNHVQMDHEPVRCDTTEDIATLAEEAREAGKIAGFRNARSYFEVGIMLQEAGFMQEDEKGNWKCPRANSFYDSVDCPEGHYKIPEAEFYDSCSSKGLPCRDGFECFCSPCVKAFEVTVFPFNNSSSDKTFQEGCDKMSVCGSVEQTKNIHIHIVDNLQRENAEVTVKVHKGTDTEDLIVEKVNDVSTFQTNWTYHFDWSSDVMGVGVMEFAINGEQIPESPLRFNVIQRKCDVDFPGENKVANENGSCECASGTMNMGGKCISSTVVAVILSIVILFIAVTLSCAFMRYKNRKGDEMWHVNPDELYFDDPVEVIGSGSFGVVLLAEYRGTKVAIKRALKGKRGKGSSRRTGSLGGSRGGSHSKTCKKPAYIKEEKDGASIESISGESDETPRTSPSADLEAANTAAGAMSNEEMSGFSKAETLSFSWFGAGGIGREKKRFAWLFPWMRDDDNANHFTESILGHSSSASRTNTLVYVLCPWFSNHSRQHEEFVNEMRTLSRLRHPCITTVMGAVVYKTSEPMLVMEYMEHGSLHDLLRNETMHLSGEIIMQVTRDIAQGLRYLHGSKPPTLHGDLKSRNILIDSRFRAKICDFGLSMKTAGAITGTPFWLAPEYLRGSTYNAACDMYSVGIIFYEIFARKSPYFGEDFKEVLQKVCNRRINKRPLIPPVTPPKFVDVMKKLWSPDPSFRPDARDLDMLLMEMTVQDAEPLVLEEIEADRPTTDLNELFPRHIAEALKAGKNIEPSTHEMVTVVFSDIVNFTTISKETSPMKVSSMLDRLYQSFDKIARAHDVFKVETIGDAYMGVTNLEGNQNHTHVKHIAEFAIEMIQEASKILVDEEDPSKGYIKIRVGFHCGPVVSNVIGSLNPRYGLFGDTVNTASRMESNSLGGRILCSSAAYKLLKEQAPKIPVTKRGKINVKGKGDMTTYWVGGNHWVGGAVDSLLDNPSSPPGKKVVFMDDVASVSEADKETLSEHCLNEL